MRCIFNVPETDFYLFNKFPPKLGLLWACETHPQDLQQGAQDLGRCPTDLRDPRCQRNPDGPRGQGTGGQMMSWETCPFLPCEYAGTLRSSGLDPDKQILIWRHAEHIFLPEIQLPWILFILNNWHSFQKLSHSFGVYWGHKIWAPPVPQGSHVFSEVLYSKWSLLVSKIGPFIEYYNIIILSDLPFPPTCVPYLCTIYLGWFEVLGALNTRPFTNVDIPLNTRLIL